MRRLILPGLALLAAATTLPSHAGDAPAADDRCNLKLITSINLDVSQNGQIYVPVTINGTDAWMTLVTSSALTILTGEAATALDLRRIAIDSSVTIGGARLDEKAILDSFSVGNVLYKSTELAVMPKKGSGTVPIEMGRPVVGMLGINVFSQFDFELHLAEKKLRLFSPDHCEGRVVYWTKEYTEVPFTKDALGMIVFPMELDGKNIEATLATNFRLSTLDSNITKRVYGFDEFSPDVSYEATGDSGGKAYFKAMALSAPGLNVANTRVQLRKGDKSCGQTSRMTAKVKAVGYRDCIGAMPLRLGMNVLTSLRIYVSTKEKVLYISRADAK